MFQGAGDRSCFMVTPPVPNGALKTKEFRGRNGEQSTCKGVEDRWGNR